MASRNNITGASMAVGPGSKAFDEGFDRIFRRPKIEDITDADEARMDVIGQNGNTGEAYEEDQEK